MTFSSVLDVNIDISGLLDLTGRTAIVSGTATGIDAVGESRVAGEIDGSSIELDLAPHGIRVNAVSPGAVPVPTLDKMHAGEIEHFWPSYVIGQNLAVDGGWMLI